MAGVYIIGGGGHCKVILSILYDLSFPVQGIIDDNLNIVGKQVMGTEIVGDIEYLRNLSQGSPDPLQAIVAIGNNKLRKKIVESLSYISIEWLSLIHKHTFCHHSVRIGEGSVVFAGAVIQPDVNVGRHCIINTAAHIDHDCIVGSYAHVAPGVGLAGGVHIGEGALVGIGSQIIPGVHVGAWSVVGAGGTVTRNIPARTLAVGTPAAVVRYSSATQ